MKNPTNYFPHLSYNQSATSRYVWALCLPTILSPTSAFDPTHIHIHIHIHNTIQCNTMLYNTQNKNKEHSMFCDEYYFACLCVLCVCVYVYVYVYVCMLAFKTKCCAMGQRLPPTFVWCRREKKKFSLFFFSVNNNYTKSLLSFLFLS